MRINGEILPTRIERGIPILVPAVFVMQQEVLSQHLINGVRCPVGNAIGFGQGESHW